MWPRTLAVVLLLVGAAPVAAEDEFERPPIAYSATVPANPVARLQAALDAGAARLDYEPVTGYLRGVLAALDVPVTSQSLVFSKTSLQQTRIRPTNPRALYFNDEVYVGYVRGGDVVEISVADPALGTVFYTLEQTDRSRPRFVRQTDDCLLCHGGGQTRGVPGHIVRSVYPDAAGQPIFSAGSHRVDHGTPFAKRFGGWIVTGDHGAAGHLGNAVYAARGPTDPRGRSLREFDLHTRLFRHPCSFLVYAPSFDSLPDELRQRFWRRLAAVLEAAPGGDGFPRLQAADRTAVREILVATKREAAAAWGE